MSPPHCVNRVDAGGVRYTSVVRAVAIAVLLVAATTTARANPAKLVAIAPVGSDARKAVAVGPDGQIYEPDGKGSWIRKRPGGTSDTIIAANGAGGNVFADAKGPALFKLHAGAWTSVHLERKAKAILGAGSRALAATGKSIYALDRGRPLKLADAPAPVLALAGSSAGVVVSTPKGLMTFKGGVFKPIKNAPKTVRTLISDRWVLVDRGVVDLKSLKTTPWPSGVRVADATTLGESLVAVGTHGKTTELYTLGTAKAAKLQHETIPFTTRVDVVGVVADKAGRVVVATRDGQVAVRDAARTWTIVTVRDELPDAKPGPAPAESP